MKFRELNIADYFSLYRFAAIPVIVIVIVFEQRMLTSILLLVSFLTDAIDGYIARKKGIESVRGAKLDSYGDLVTLLLGLAAFITFETEYFIDHLTLIVITLSLFAFQIVISFLRFKGASSFHTYLAKITAVLFAAFLVITPVKGPINILFYVTFCFAIAEAIEEIIITFLLEKPKENVKGLYWLIKHSDVKLNL
jgi:CDP-diacylglycerol--glycerol-3-phosphate 3-phosphatidyltransferase